MHGHLGASVQGKLRNGLPGQPEQARILNNGGISPAAVQKIQEPDCLLYLPVIKKGVNCNINLDAPDMGKMNRPA
ncbi:MAG: hypothetical protein BWY80_01250 [Firmicutes bacterium ADurb.Bin456]|nr:MAG: hypothetical protein BWY80_01250 [Firmicutes bacterium ADurb.Bin456]